MLKTLVSFDYLLLSIFSSSPPPQSKPNHSLYIYDSTNNSSYRHLLPLDRSRFICIMMNMHIQYPYVQLVYAKICKRKAGRG